MDLRSARILGFFFPTGNGGSVCEILTFLPILG